MEQGANICCSCRYERFHGKFSDERVFREKGGEKSLKRRERDIYIC